VTRLERPVGAEARAGAPGATGGSAEAGAPGGAGARSHEPIPLARPLLGEAEERAVLEVLRSGQLSLGPRLPQFERAFAARVGAGHASAVSSGTAGLHLALRAIGVGEGDEVITTPLSFVASANAILYQGAQPVFVDIDPVTLNLDPVAVREERTERTRGILPVHLFGYPADIPAFEALGLPIVEDACEALGAVHADGTPVGGRGHPAVFGFYPNKQITTGEGGVVTTDDPEMKAVMDAERNQGRASGMAWLEHDRLGFNYRLSEIACALGLAQLGHLDDLISARAAVAERYREALAGIEGLELPCLDADGNRRSWFVFVVALPRHLDRDEAARALAERGIQTRPYLPAIHLQRFYRERFGHREGEFPVCEDFSARSLALPFFPQMTEGQVLRVAESMREVMGG
jgi:perosamine synthetase